MTTIIGVQYENKCILYADSQIDDDGQPFKHPNLVKITKHGQYLVAVAGDLHMLQFLCYAWQIPVPTADDLKNPYRFMVTTIVPALRDELKEANLLPDKDDDEIINDFSMLLCLNSDIFQIDSDFAVTQDVTNFYGIGSGSPYALGALHAGASPQKAMEIAQKLDRKTNEPFIKREQRRTK
jgi:ATP-dependent protease HslVU (ClpYQ) peptidase subunit